MKKSNVESVSIQELLKHLIHVTDEQKAERITAYELKDPVLYDFVLVVSVQNKVHCKGLMNTVVVEAKKLDLQSNSEFFDFPRVSGQPESEWVTIDFNTIVVHIINDQLRQYYQLDDILQQRAVTWHH